MKEENCNHLCGLECYWNTTPIYFKDVEKYIGGKDFKRFEYCPFCGKKFNWKEIEEKV